jgi:3D (Asp-Asp-Asp) domain-containing protein
MKSSLLRGGAAVAAALLAVFLMFYGQATIAETLDYGFQEPIPPQQQHSIQQSSSGATPPTTAISEPAVVAAGGDLAGSSLLIPVREFVRPPAENSAALPVAPPQTYIATAYSFRGRTASGRLVGRGIIAADRSVLPLGTRVRIEAGAYSGEYLVADTGSAIRGRRIDIWIQDVRDAIRFGRRPVRLTVLKWGGRRGLAPRTTRTATAAGATR